MTSEAHFSEVFLKILYERGYPFESVKRQFKLSKNRIVDFGIFDNVSQNLLAFIECVRSDRKLPLSFEQVRSYARLMRDSTPALFVVLFGENNFDVYIAQNDKETFSHTPEFPTYNFLKASGWKNSIKIKLDEINEELIKYLAKHPSKMYDLSPHRFEELVAELFRDMGYNVYLTPKTRDGGRDILAIMNVFPNKQYLVIVECKRFNPHDKVGIDIVERFLYTVREKDKANAGLIATTSYFSKEAKNLQEQYKWLLSLNDFDNLKEWLSYYGKWTKSSTSQGIWLPNAPLA